MVRVRDVILDLFERTRREEARGRDREHALAGRGESGCNADQILLGDADFNDLRAQRFTERRQLAAAA